MKRFLSNFGLGVTALLLSAGASAAEDVVHCEDYSLKADMCVTNGLNGFNEGDPAKWMLSPVAWSDACQPARVGWTTTQGAADQFSWRKFTALSWPAMKGQNGVPDEKEMLGLKMADGEGATTVWETYKPLEQVFNYNDPNWEISPDDWNKEVALPAECPSVEGARLITGTAKAPP